MPKKLRFKTEKEWLAYKAKRISASIIGSIAGLNKYTSPYQVWESITGRTESVTTLPMLRGRYFEDGVKKIFQHENEITFLRNPDEILMYEHDDYDFIAVSPDDEAIYEGEEMLVEIKTTRVTFGVDEIPPYYHAQVQFQLGVSGYKKCLFIWWDLVRDNYQFTIIDFDKEYYDLLIDAAISFNEHVLSDTPPPMTTEYDFDSIKSIENSLNPTEEIYANLVRIRDINDKIKSLESTADALKLTIKQFMGENDKLIIGKDVLATYKSSTKESIDIEKLKTYTDVYPNVKKITNLRSLLIKYGKLNG